MRPYDLSWPICMTCDECDCSCETEGMEITGGGHPTKSKPPSERHIKGILTPVLLNLILK